MHNERCTPGSGTGAGETAGGNPGIGAPPPRSLASATGAAGEPAPRPQAALRGLHPQVAPRRAWSMEFNCLHAQREAGAAYIASQKSEGWIALPDHYDDGGFSGGTLERPALQRLLRDIEAGHGRRRRGLQDRPPQPLADGLRQAGRGVRAAQRHLRLRHPAVQHHDLDGPADAQHPALLRPVRARGHRRAHPGQVRGLAQEGHVDGRLAAARLRGRGPQAGGGRARGGARAPDLRPLRQDRLGARGGPRAERRAARSRSAASAPTAPAAASPGQGRRLQGARQPGLPRRGGAQGRRLPRRARGDHRPARVGQGARRHGRAGAPARRRDPGPDAGAAEGPDLRPERPADVADPHPPARPDLPLLRRPARRSRTGTTPAR